jgi:hypothetical protein
LEAVQMTMWVAFSGNVSCSVRVFTGIGGFGEGLTGFPLAAAVEACGGNFELRGRERERVRVTRLGEFSPVGRLSALGRF